MTEKKIELPKQETKAERVNPYNMVIYGLPKSGKTTAVVELPNHLLIDYEEGSKFVNGVKIAPPEGLGPVAKFKWLKDVAAEIRAAGKPYDYVIIDTFSQIDEDSEFTGTFRYMNSVQGKGFNRADKGGVMLKPDDPNYSSVHTLPEGFGYRWSRSEITDMYQTLSGLGKICTIFITHVADKFLASKSSNTEVVTRTLALTGKVKDIIARKVDCIGYLYNEDGKTMISFKGNEDRIGGIRAKHVVGYEGPLDWSKIFITEEKETNK